MKQNKVSERTAIAAFFGTMLGCLALLSLALGATHGVRLGSNPFTIGTVIVLAGALVLYYLAWLYHAFDTAFRDIKQVQIKSPASESTNVEGSPGRELTVAERVCLASHFYGQYTYPLTLFDASAETDEAKRMCLYSDLQCAMDNLRVPFLESQMSPEQRDYLSKQRFVYPPRPVGPATTSESR